MLERLKSFFLRSPAASAGDGAGVRISAKTELPTPEAPRVRAKPLVLPSFLRTAKPNPKNPLTLDDRRLINTDVTSYRNATSTREAVRQFVKSSPDLSGAVTSYLRTGITNGHLAYAKNPDGTFNPEATSALHQVITRMNILSDYSVGYDDSQSLRSLSETLAWELVTIGGMGAELVLDKSLLPDKIQAVSITQIEMFPSSDGRRLIPHQRIAGEDIVLDVPTFFMVNLDQDPRSAYAESPLEPALQAVLFSEEFLNDLRRIVKKAIHPRVVITIDQEKFLKTMPTEYQHDQQKAIEYRNAVLAEIQNQVNGLAPEDALIVFDTYAIDVTDHGNTNLSNEYKVIQEIADSKLATGAKVLPTVLGHSNGTSNVASAEVLMFMKYVEGTVWSKLNEMYSKIFTLAVRLLGHDVYCEFSFKPIDLKPDSELEAFRSMKQSRVLEQLSLGFVSDDEAGIELTGHLPPVGFKPLSGTGFFQAKAVPAGDGYNGASNKGSTMNQATSSDAPKGGARGSNKKADGGYLEVVV